MNTDFERDAELFLQDIIREHYLNDAGHKETIDIVPIYQRYGWLFERPAVDRALTRDDEQGKYLAAFAAEGYLGTSVKELSEKITNATSRATVEWQGEQVPYRRAAVLIANEPDSAKRHDLESRVQQKTEEQNPDRLHRMQDLHNQARDLGFENYRAMCDRLKALHLEWLLAATGPSSFDRAQDGSGLLDRTEDVYQSELAHYLDALGVRPEDATPADLAHLFRAPRFDPLFAADRLIPSLKQTLSGMGIDLEAQQNVLLDTESRPLKSPRAFCAPVRAPEEVYLVISPRGGQDDYKALLHESGHAEHFAHVDPDLPFAFKRLGDGAVSESYAFLMDNLLKNHHWFAEVARRHHVDDYLRLARFHKLWIIRRYSAKLAYEVRLHANSDISSMPQEYSRTLRQALKINISPVNYLSDVDDALYAAEYLRAWIFEVMLRRHLEDSLGALWFACPGTGKFLINLWREGQRYPVDELAHQLKYEGLDAEPLMTELAR